MGPNASLSSCYQATQLFVLQNRASETLMYHTQAFTYHTTCNVPFVHSMYTVPVQYCYTTMAAGRRLSSRAENEMYVTRKQRISLA